MEINPHVSKIKNITYDSTTQTLGIDYKNSATVRYFDVTENIYYELLLSKTPDEFVKNVLLGRYKKR